MMVMIFKDSITESHVHQTLGMADYVFDVIGHEGDVKVRVIKNRGECDIRDEGILGFYTKAIISTLNSQINRVRPKGPIRKSLDRSKQALKKLSQLG